MAGEREPRKGRPGRTVVHDMGAGFAVRRKVLAEVDVAEVMSFDLKKISENGSTEKMLLSVEMKIRKDAAPFDRRLALDAALREVAGRVIPDE